MTEVAEVLAAHYATGGFAARYWQGEHEPGWWGCACGAGGPVASGVRVVAQHRAHVAEQIQLLIDAEKQRAVEEATALGWDVGASEGLRTPPHLGYMLRNPYREARRPAPTGSES